MFKKYTKFILFVSIFFISINIIAQGDPSPCPDGGPPPCPPPPLPIDGGVGLLLVLGAGYAIKKLKKQE